MARVAASCRVALLTAIGTLSCSCMHGPTVVRSAPAAGADFGATIASLDRVDPNSPQALEAHLEYADFLLEQGTGPCGQRLDLAQSQADVVARNPGAKVVFPGGWSRVADLQYRIHRERAVCDTDPLVQAHELQAAVQSAQQAVQTYREEFDYASMAVAQFNVAATYHAAAEDTAAIAALETAIKMDREFGLPADAQDNYGLLLSWRKQPAGADQVAQLMRDFPSRSITLKFAWAPGDALVTIDTTHSKAVEEREVQAHSSRTFARRIRAVGDDWVVSDASTDGPIDSGVWLRYTAGAGETVATFRPELLQFPPIEITHAGDFKEVNELAAFATRLAADSERAIRAQAPKDERAPAALNDALRAAQVAFAPEVIENQLRENYELESAMWIDATLQQGVQYELIAPLPLPGSPHVVAYHQLHFSFTREVPCTSESLGHSCVELIVRATPQEEPLQEVLGLLHFPHGETLRYSSVTTVRVVADPQTLRPYLHETRRYWYVTLGKRVPDRELLEADHSVISATYR